MTTTVSGNSGGTAITTTTLASSLPTYVPGYLFGLTLSTAGSSATFGVAAGSAMNSTATANMVLASAYTKTTSAWAVGSGNGSLDTGAVANSTWYHVHLIQRPDTGVVDLLTSLSATAPTMPANYTLFRRIGSMKTNGSAQWQSFVQKGDYFYIILTTDFTAGATSTATLRTLSVPTGIVVLPLLTLYGGGGGGGTNLFQLAPASDATLLAEVFRVGSQDLSYINVAASTAIGPSTNTSAQIYVAVPNYYSAAPPTLSTYGWIDMRGKDS